MRTSAGGVPSRRPSASVVTSEWAAVQYSLALTVCSPGGPGGRGGAAGGDAVLAAAERIGLRLVREGKRLVGIEPPRPAIGLGEALVEEDARRRDGRGDAVDHPAAGLVLVEPLVDEVAQIPPALGRAVGERPADRRA